LSVLLLTECRIRLLFRCEYYVAERPRNISELFTSRQQGAFFDSPEKGLLKGHCGLNRARTSRGQYAFLLLKMRNTVIVMI
jgi:hypothetical protein